MMRLLADLFGPLLRWLGWACALSRLTYDIPRVPWVAVFLARSTDCLTHSGIIYRIDERGGRAFLHLAGHRRLSRTPVADCIMAIPDLHTEDEEFLAGFCRAVYTANRNRTLLYSFEY